MAKLKRYTSFEALKSDATDAKTPLVKKSKQLSDFEAFMHLAKKELKLKCQTNLL